MDISKAPTPQFARIVDRLEAWWHGQVIDRPPLTLAVKPGRSYTGPTKSHDSLRQRWLDIEWAVESTVAELMRLDYVGDSFPVYFPNVGPELTAAIYGCELEFTPGSSWSRPIVNDPSQWRRLLATQPDFQNVYWRAVEQMTDYAVEISAGRFLVGLTDLHGNYDILAGLRDPQELCQDMIECPELVMQAGKHVSKGFVECFQRSYAKLTAAGLGCTTWLPFYHDGPAYVPSCDFWAMVSHQMARDMILPNIVTEIAPLARSIFHLDGPQALRHLDLLLELPQLDAVQWVYGAGNGPGRRWLDVYKRIRAAGKSVQFFAQNAVDALAIFDSVGCAGMWCYVEDAFNCVDEAQAFVNEVARCGKRS